MHVAGCGDPFQILALGSDLGHPGLMVVEPSVWPQPQAHSKHRPTPEQRSGVWLGLLHDAGCQDSLQGQALGSDLGLAGLVVVDSAQ
jgi:hypothetical protein